MRRPPRCPAPRSSTTPNPWGGEPLAHQAGNFSRGDKASWDNALQARMQGQNENVRIGGGAAR